MKINTSNRISSVSPILYGIFFEDINYAGDGGLYAELIANRSFEYYDRNKDYDRKEDNGEKEYSNGKEDYSKKKDDGKKKTADLRKLCWETIGDCHFSIGTKFPLSHAHSNYARLTGGVQPRLRQNQPQSGGRIPHGLLHRLPILRLGGELVAGHHGPAGHVRPRLGEEDIRRIKAQGFPLFVHVTAPFRFIKYNRGALTAPP